jgi:uncharacterized Tic20 family protein
MLITSVALIRLEEQETEFHQINEAVYSVIEALRIVITLVAVFVATSGKIHQTPHVRMFWILLAFVLPEFYLVFVGMRFSLG